MAAVILCVNLSGGHLETVTFEPVGKKNETIIGIQTFKSIVNIVPRRLSFY